MSSASFQLGPKGRACLPASVRRAAGIAEGARLVATADGDGRVVLETEDALRARVRAAAPDPVGPRAGLSATADLRAVREADARLADTAAARRALDVSDPDAGRRLLEHLRL